jgi:hypothetical protein
VGGESDLEEDEEDDVGGESELEEDEEDADEDMTMDVDEPESPPVKDYFPEVLALDDEDDDDEVIIDEERSTIPNSPPPPPDLDLEELTLDEQTDIDKYMYPPY